MEKTFLGLASRTFVVEGNTVQIGDLNVVIENNMMCVVRDKSIILNSGLGFAIREHSVPSFLCRAVKDKARGINALFAAARRTQ